ncbi:MAG: DUF1080 domain-containing protein [Bacteroidota bacterium]
MNQKNSIKKALVFALFILAAGNNVYAQTQTPPQTTPPTPPRWVPEMTEFYSPEVPLVTAGKPSGNAYMTAPSDATILFDGKDLSKWKGKDGGAAKWDVKDGTFTVKKGTGDISSVMDFNDFQLHIEWLIPANITGKGQARGNSGIFLQGIYEVQVLDNYNNENKTYVNGQAGSIYKQTAPLRNVVNAPGQWNSYDIIYTAPRFKEDSSLFSPAYVTLIHNGVVIQNHTQLKGNTPYIGLPRYRMHGKGPIKLQDHGDPSEPVSYRNIWIREL